MRLLAPVFLLAIGSASATARTLWSPLPIEGGTALDTRSSCPCASDTVVYDGSLDVTGPRVAYRVDNPSSVPTSQLHPWRGRYFVTITHSPSTRTGNCGSYALSGVHLY